MSLVCFDCKEDWEISGKSYKRVLSSRLDYKCKCGSKRTPVDGEVLSSNVKLAKQLQDQRDRNRIHNKSFREYARVENAVRALSEALLETLKKNSNVFKPIKTAKKIDTSGEVGVIQITDAHLNELIDLPSNKYDITIASQRAYKLIREACAMFKPRGIDSVVLVFTGDLMNSDRRLDEKLSMATNRSKAMFVAADLFSKMLYDVRENFGSVSVVSVLGNESRIDKEMSFADHVISDNYDFSIMNIVKILLSNTDISFSALDQMELIVNINGHKCLVTHDINRSTGSQTKAQSAVGMKYLGGTPIDCVMGGHIHATKNDQFSYRAASLAGSNSFNERALGLIGRASQNLYIFGRGYRHSIGVDLQDTEVGAWYDIEVTLMEYNCKSLSKTFQKHTIMEIIV